METGLAILWWLMLATGLAAAALSAGVAVLDRRQPRWPSHATRFYAHLASYGLLTVSILAFAARGLLGSG